MAPIRYVLPLALPCPLRILKTPESKLSAIRAANRPKGWAVNWTPPPQRPRPDSQHAQHAGDEEFPARHQFPALASPGSVSVTGRDSQHALLSPIAYWLSYDGPFPRGDPARSFDYPVFAVAFEGLPPTRTFVRGDREAPISTALKVGGANLASPTDFQKVGADGEMEPPLTTGGYKVRALGDRFIQVDGKCDWRVRVRSGPCASGEGANSAQSAPCAAQDPCQCVVDVLAGPGTRRFPVDHKRGRIAGVFARGLFVGSFGGNHLPSPHGDQTEQCLTRQGRLSPFFYEGRACSRPAAVLWENTIPGRPVVSHSGNALGLRRLDDLPRIIKSLGSLSGPRGMGLRPLFLRMLRMPGGASACKPSPSLPAVTPETCVAH